jgi:hypothetical protein
MALKIEGEKIFYDCILCQKPFQFGPHVYNGRHIAEWDTQICDSCVKWNWDGVVPERHPRLMEHLREKGISVHLNARGWLDVPPRQGSS